MREYTTLEMIEEIMENHSLTFKTISSDLYKKACNEEEVEVYYDKMTNQLRWKHNNHIMPMSACIYKNKWTKVQKPVPVMEAVKAYHTGKEIKVVMKDNKDYTYKPEYKESDRYGYHIKTSLAKVCLTSGEILEGEWYILD